MRLNLLDRALARLEEGIAALSLVAAVTLTITAVLLRYLFDYVIFWSEEASLYLIILSTFVGAVIALRHNDHVGVELLSLVVKGRGKRVVAAVAGAVLLVYAAVFGVVGWVMVTGPVASSYTTPALGLPLWLVQLSLAVGLTLLLIRSLQILYRTVRGRDPFPDAEAKLLEEEEVAT